MKTIGITGGSGFIGGHVRDVLRFLGYETVVFDRSPHGELEANERFFLGDVRDETAVFELAAHVDGIVHLAAVLGTQETIQNPRPSVETNVIGSLNVFEAANHYDLPVVYAGVGNHFMRLDGGGSYTISKSAAEDYARMFNKYRGGKISVVRPVNAYGPGQSVAEPYGSSRVRKIIPSFVCRALVGDDIEIYGDGEQVSDCVHVRDVADVFVNALEHADILSPVMDIEVGPTDSVTVNTVAELVLKHANSSSNVIHLPMRPGETPNAVVSANTESLRVLGMSADEFISLEAGIAETVEWYSKNWLPGFFREA